MYAAEFSCGHNLLGGFPGRLYRYGICGMFTLHSGITQIYSWTFFAGFCLLFSSVAAIISSKKKCLKMVNGFYPIMDLSKLSSLILFFTFIGLTVIMGYFGNNAFIYGKF